MSSLQLDSEQFAQLTGSGYTRADGCTDTYVYTVSYVKNNSNKKIKNPKNKCKLFFNYEKKHDDERRAAAKDSPGIYRVPEVAHGRGGCGR